MRMTLPIGAALGAVLLCAGTIGAQAASAVQKECSQKYQAAKAADQLAGMTYNQYYSKCAADIRAEKAGGAAPTTTAAPAPAPTTTAPAPAPTTTAAPAPAPTTRTASPAPAPAAGGAAVFPTAISPEFSKDSAGKGRRETCLAQYRKNKEANGNGGLKWIEKGGGYYSECNKRLKG